MAYRSDPKLVQACLRGEAAAWDALVERYGRLVYSIPRKYGLRDADVDDVFQAVFLNLHRSLERLRDQTRLSSWLITASHRETWRVGKQRDYQHLDEAMPDVSAPEEDDLVRWERQQLVREALRELGGRCETLLTLLFLDRQAPSYDEIAERLGMPVGSIGPTRARCCSKLVEVLASRGLTSDDLEL